MKKEILILIITSFSFVVYAQQSSIKVNKEFTFQNPMKSNLDTLSNTQIPENASCKEIFQEKKVERKKKSLKKILSNYEGIDFRNALGFSTPN
jgi:hypothetical protein